MDYEAQLNKMKEAQKKSAIADLENTRNQALSDLEAEKESNARNFATQRNQTNVQNQLAAKNFKEYLVNSGRANSGVMPQYEMNRQNNLQRNLNEITGNENVALADIGRRNTLANQQYNSGLQSANAQIEANYISNLLAQQQAAWERQMQEKQFNEQVRQYNENLAFQKQQYADSLARQSLGSGGGSRGRKSSSKKSSGKTSSGNSSSYASQLLNQLSSAQSKVNSTKGLTGLGLAAKYAANSISAINNAYASGKITKSEKQMIEKQLGL